MEVIVNGDKIKLKVGDWVRTHTGVFGSIIKIDEISDCILVGKERAFGSWIDTSLITDVEQNGGFSSSFDRMVDQDAPPVMAEFYDDRDPNIFGPPDYNLLPDFYEEQSDKIKSDKANKEHSKNGIDKPQFSLIPQHAIIEVAKVFMYGAKKYDAYNYSKGEKNTVYTDACMRHINQYLLGNDNDDESKLLHLAHAVANLMMIIDNTIIGTNIEGRNGIYKV